MIMVNIIIIIIIYKKNINFIKNFTIIYLKE